MSEKPDVNDATEIPAPETPEVVEAEPVVPAADETAWGDALASTDDDVTEAIDAVVIGEVDDDDGHEAPDDVVVADGEAVGAGVVDAEVVGAQPDIPPPDDQLIAILEALIFASPDPITLKALTKLLDPEPVSRIEAAIVILKTSRYDEQRGLQVVEVANGYQIVTRSELHEWVRRLFHERTTQKLSVPALETLAVIAYKQPVTAAEIAEIRSVNTSGVLGTLMDRRLIKIAGRKAVVGRPFMYATTREFLERFGLRDLNDLPKIEDMADVLGFDPPLLDDTAVATALPFDGAVDSRFDPVETTARVAGDAEATSTGAGGVVPASDVGDTKPTPADDAPEPGDNDA